MSNGTPNGTPLNIAEPKTFYGLIYSVCVTILRSNGVFALMIVVAIVSYVWFGMIPESESRRKALDVMQATMQQIAQAEVTQAEAVGKMHQFRIDTDKAHAETLAAVKANQEFLRAVAKKIQAETPN
jgi:hypothetical protein